MFNIYCYYCASQKVEYVISVKISYKLFVQFNVLLYLENIFFRLKRIYGRAEDGCRGAASRSNETKVFVNVLS